MTDFNPLVNASANAVNTVAENSLLAALAILSLTVAVACVWVVLKQARQCSESTKTSLDANTKAIGDLQTASTQQAHAMQLALIEFKSVIQGMKQ